MPLPATGVGSIDLDVAAGVAVDGQGKANAAAPTLTVPYDMVRPEPTISFWDGAKEPLVLARDVPRFNPAAQAPAWR